MRMPPHRRLMPPVAVATATAVAGVVVAGITGALGASDAAGLAVAAVVLGGLTVVLIALRAVLLRLTALSRRVSATERAVTAVLTDPPGPADRRGAAGDLRARLDALGEEVPALAARVARLAGLERAMAMDYAQLEAYVDVRSLIRPRGPMPPLRGWAASPDVVRHLAATLQRVRPKLIVECGSGSSGIWLGYFAERIGSARVVCLEHDEHYCTLSRELVRAHGLGDVVEVRLAPLRDWPYGDRTYRWYDTDALADLTGIGLLFVDGPPGATGPQARFPALPLLSPRCADDAVIVLDDAGRNEELAVSDRWLAEFPELEREVLRFDKGAHVFTRRPA